MNNLWMRSRLFEEATGEPVGGAPPAEGEDAFADILAAGPEIDSTAKVEPVESLIEASEPVVAKPVVTAPVAVPPAAPVAAPVPAPQPAAVQPSAPPVVQSPAAPAAPQPSVPEPVEDVEVHRAKVIELKNQAANEIAASYAAALTDEDKFELANSPEIALPKLAGKLYTDIYESVFASVEAILPAKIMMAQHAAFVARQNDTDFFTKFSDLNKPEFHEDIRQTALLFMKMYPQQNREQLMTGIGTFLRQRYGLIAPVPVAPPAAPVVQPARTIPFAPAIGRGPAAAPAGNRSDIEQFFDELVAVGE